MTDSGSFSELVMELAEEFLERYRNGERPPLAEYIAKHPQLEDEIREVFPAMAMMENIAIDDESLHDSEESTAAETTLKQIGDYRILREAGRGGMGVVYEAEQLSLGRRVAVKVLPQQALLNEKHKRRFQREAKAAARLHHTNIVPVFGVGEQDGMHYYVMQFIQGLGLDEVLKELRRMRLNSEAPTSSMPGRRAATGSSGSGKTFSAARVARSLVSGQFERTMIGDLDEDDSGSGNTNRTVSPASGTDRTALQSQTARTQLTGAPAGPRDPHSPGLSGSDLSGSLSLSGSLTLSGQSDSDSASTTRIKRKQTLFTSVARIGEQVASALQYAHEQGITHRDIKPANLLLDMHGTVWVTDFGLAKASDQDDITHTGDILGTLRYMPPEAFEGRSDPRGDQYSLGLTLYELIAQRPAFEERDRHKLIKLVTTTEPSRIERLNPDVPRDLATIIHKAIDRDPSHRYVSAKALREDLQRFLDDEPIKARRTSTTERLVRWSRRNRGLASSMGVVCILLLVINIAGPLMTLRMLRLNEDLEDKQTRLNATIRSLEQTQGDLETQRDRANLQATEMEELAGEMASLATDEAAAREHASQLLYATDMQLAAQIWRNHEAAVAEVRDRLDAHIPAGHAKDRRGFEWYYHDHLAKHSATVFSGHLAPVVASALTADDVLVSLDERGTLKRWDLTTRQEVATFDLRTGRDIGLTALAPDGTRVAWAAGTTIQLIDTADGNTALRLAAPDGVVAMAFSPDGGTLVTVSNSQKQMHWWNTADGTKRASASTESLARLPVLNVADKGLVVAAAGYGRYGGALSIFRLNPDSGHVSRQQHDPLRGTLGPIALSPDGTLVAFGFMLSSSVEVRSTDSFDPVAYNATAHGAPATALIFANDGAKLISAGGDGAIRVWSDARKLEDSELTLKGHQSAVHQLFLSPAGTRLISSGEDRTARIWDPTRPAEAFHPFAARRNKSRSNELQYSPDGLLVARPDGSQIELCDPTTGDIVRTLPADEQGTVFSIAFAPDGRTLAAGYGHPDLQSGVSHIRLWDVATGESVARLPGVTDLTEFASDNGVNEPVGALAFSPDGRYLAAGFGAEYVLPTARNPVPIKVFDVATRRLLRTLDGHLGHCVALDFSGDGALLASASYDGTARIWSTRTWKTRHVLQNPDLIDSEGYRRFADLDFSPDPAQTLLALASREGSVIFWDYRADTHDSLTGHSTAVRAVAFSPNGRTLASASADQTLRLWNVETRRQVLRLNADNVWSLSFSPDGRQLLTSTGVWNASPPLWDEPARAAERLRAVLDSQADFQRSIRMLSENRNLHESLQILHTERPNASMIEAALAATRANWHASQDEWGQAAAEFDRLIELQSDQAEDWLRTPGQLRLAMALLHENRPREAAALLTGGADQRIDDGLPAIEEQMGFGFARALEGGVLRLTAVFPGSSAAQTNMRVGDVILKINDTQLPSNPLSLFRELTDEPEGTVVRMTVRHPDGEIEEVELARKKYRFDPATGNLLFPLIQTIEERLAQSPRDPGLLELRAALAGQWSGFEEQVADYTAALTILAESDNEDAAVHTARLHRLRGDAHLAQQNWQAAADDYSQVITEQTTDDGLLTSQAMVRTELLNDPWKTIEPLEMESLGGATLRQLDDGSILAGGRTPDDEVYTITFEVDEPQIAGIVLETLPHSSLPKGAAGRESPRGNFLIAEVGISILTDSGERRPVLIRRAWADESLEQGDDGQSHDIGLTIDGDLTTHWTTYPNHGQPHVVLYEFEQSLEDTGPLQLQIRIDCRSQQWKQHALGCFRLSTFARPGAMERRQRVAERGTEDPWARLAAALWINDDQSALTRLITERPSVAGPVGDLYASTQEWERAIEVYSLAITDDTTDSALLSGRARACEQLGDWKSAGRDWMRAAATSSDGPKLLTEFGKRLADRDQFPLAIDHYRQAEQLLSQALEVDPANPFLAGDLAAAMQERITLEQQVAWSVLRPTEMDSTGRAELTVEADGSVFVSGENIEADTYTLAAPLAAGSLHALKLEVIPDERLPQGRAGRAENGEFRFAEFEAALITDGMEQVLVIENAISASGDELIALWDGSSASFWTGDSSAALRQSIVFDVADVPVEAETVLRVRIRFADGETGSSGANLGRFRLSSVDNPAALAQFESLAATAGLSDPWVKLATVVSVDGRLDDAAQIAGRAYQELDSWENRKALLEQLGTSSKLLPAVASLHPNDPQLKLAMARQALRAGQEKLSVDAPADAIPPLEQAREIVNRLQAEFPVSDWSVPTPVEFQSEGGAVLTLQADGSILASGPNPSEDTYTIVLEPELRRIPGFRLELLPDSSLPRSGSGRHSTGRCSLSEFTVTVVAAEDASETTVIWGGALRPDAGDAIDGSLKTSWSPYPEISAPESAVFQPKEAIEVPPGTRIVVRLANGTAGNIGRFRLWLTDDPTPLSTAELHFDLQPSELVELHASLGTAFGLQGRSDEALASLAQAARFAEEYDAAAKIVQAASLKDDVLEQLAQQTPNHALLQAALMHHSIRQQELPRAAATRQQTIPLLEQMLAAHPTTALADDLAATLLADTSNEIAWTVLKPVKITSTGGDTFTVHPDGSVLAEGGNPGSRNQYTVVCETELPRVTAVRLEALTDDSLPANGPGRQADGRFVMTRFLLAYSGLAPAGAGSSESGEKTISFSDVAADYCWHRTESDRSYLSPAGMWNINHGSGRPHRAIFAPADELQGRDGFRLTFSMHFLGNEQYPHEGLGCFRISVTDDAEAFEAARRELPPQHLSDAWARLGAAYVLSGDPQTGARYLAKVLERESNPSDRAQLVGQIEEYGSVLPPLLDLLPDDPLLLAAVTRYRASRGQQYLAAESRPRAISRLRREFDNHAGNATVAGQLADLLLSEATTWSTLEPLTLRSEGGATLEQQQGGTIVASGETPDQDVYEIVTEVEANSVAALRLEAFPHPSLKTGSYSRSEDGDVQLSEFEVAFAPPADSDSWMELQLEEAVSTNSSGGSKLAFAIDGDLQTHWAVRHNPTPRALSATFRPTAPIPLPGRVRLRLRLHFAYPHSPHQFGHFRLSVSSDANAFAIEKRRCAALDIADAFTRLGAAYVFSGDRTRSRQARQMLARALEAEPGNATVAEFLAQLSLAAVRDGNRDEGVRIARRTLSQLKSSRARMTYLEHVGHDLRLLTALARDGRREPQLQLAVARHSASAGQRSLEDGEVEDASAHFQQVRETLARLVTESPPLEWTVLTPVELQSEQGAILTLQSDGSILAGGPSLKQDTYTIVIDPEHPMVTAFRLELLPDPSLPKGGSGRHPDHGNCFLSEFQVSIVTGEGEAESPVVWDHAFSNHRVAAADHYAKREMHARNAIDGDTRSWWEPWPSQDEPKSVVFLPNDPIPTPAGTRLIIRLVSSGPQDSIGRFRLALTDAPDPLPAAQLHFDLRNDLAKLFAALGEGDIRLDRRDDALAALVNGLNFAVDHDLQTEIIAAAASEGLLEPLIKQTYDRSDRHRQRAFAAALHSTIRSQIDDKEMAEAEQSLRITQEVYRDLQNPNPDSRDLELRIDHILVQIALGELHWEAARQAEAHEAWQACLDELRQLRDDHPDEPALRSRTAAEERAISHHYGGIGLWEYASEFARTNVRLNRVTYFNRDAWQSTSLLPLGEWDVFRMFGQQLDAERRKPGRTLHAWESATLAWQNCATDMCEVPGDTLLELAHAAQDADPATVWFRFVLAMAQFRTGQLEETLETLDEYPWGRGDASHPALNLMLSSWYLRALVYIRLQQPEAALEAFDSGEADYKQLCLALLDLDADPSSPVAKRAAFWKTNWWWLAYTQQLRNEARQQFLSTTPPDPWQHLIQARGYRLIGEIKRADAELAAAAASAGDDWDVRVARVELLQAWDEHDRAETEWQHLLASLSRRIDEGPPRIELHRLHGRLLFEAGRWDEALEDFTRAIDLGDHTSANLIKRGQCRLLLHMPEQALQDFAKACRSENGFAVEMIDLMWMCLLRETPSHRNGVVTFTATSADSDQAVSDQEVPTGIEDPETMLQHASWLLLTNQFEQYGNFSREALRLHADEGTERTNYLLARMLALDPQAAVSPERALSLARASVNDSQPAAWHVHTLGLALLRLGQYEQAIAQFQRSADADWQWGTGCNWLGLSIAYFHSGRREEAQRCLRRAREWCEEWKTGQIDLRRSQWDFEKEVHAHDRIAAQLLLREAEALIER